MQNNTNLNNNNDNILAWWCGLCLIIGTQTSTAFQWFEIAFRNYNSLFRTRSLSGVVIFIILQISTTPNLYRMNKNVNLMLIPSWKMCTKTNSKTLRRRNSQCEPFDAHVWLSIVTWVSQVVFDLKNDHGLIIICQNLFKPYASSIKCSEKW